MLVRGQRGSRRKAMEAFWKPSSSATRLARFTVNFNFLKIEEVLQGVCQTCISGRDPLMGQKETVVRSKRERNARD